ncbi:hypothetical protein QC823_15990 [Halomonas vilamensis]|uniref:Uncharacterized protein n=1 Tax=Vreelandella vilamensis TaxID=531309 RepID=A0ABU1H833_9GAMM|nr:hypothetical protein [Halomonas vilamensis]MDR5900465.1 hypothetical protein [Halomonas vilamensis]
MLYGYYRRVGVYMMQEAFRLLGCEQRQEDVDLVKATLTSLPEWHAARPYVSSATDLSYDAGIVDTFLHPQDRAYTVPQLMDFAAQAGLGFWDWADRLAYNAEAGVPEGHPLHARLPHLSEVDRWAVMEIIAQTRGTHRFILARPERMKTVPPVDFTTDDYLKWVPRVRHLLEVVHPEDKATGRLARLKRDWHEFDLTPEETLLVKYVNGEHTVADILGLIKTQDRVDLSQNVARAFFARMYDQGHFLFHHAGAHYQP